MQTQTPIRLVPQSEDYKADSFHQEEILQRSGNLIALSCKSCSQNYYRLSIPRTGYSLEF